MRLHAVTSTFILCKPEAEGSSPFISTNSSGAVIVTVTYSSGSISPAGAGSVHANVSPAPLPW